MSSPPRSPSLFWILAPVCALGILFWSDASRIRRIEFETAATAQVAPVDPRSPTGYADGKRWLIVPEHDNATYQWIQETQLMLARGDWRVRDVAYENAPFGRPAHNASLYRWWLVAVAWVDHAFTGRPLALEVERAALFANPALHALLVVAASLFAAWRWGAVAAAFLSLGLCALFPLAGAFVPGVANDFGLELCLSLGSLLLILAGTRASTHASRWYFAAGIFGGCGLWVSAMLQVPLVVGIAAGGLLAATLGRGQAGPLPWRAWALGGAVSSLLAYMVEYYPGHMDFELRVNSPLYGIAWLGLGELLARYGAWAASRVRPRGLRALAATLLAAAAVASLPIALWRVGNRGFLTDDLLSSRLTHLPDGVVASSAWAWIQRDGASGMLAAAFAPLLFLVPAAWLLLRSKSGPAPRACIAIALGPIFVALAFAWVRIRWWNTLDVTLLALVVAAVSAFPTLSNPRIGCWGASAILGVVLAFSVAAVIPRDAGGSGEFKFTRAEVEGLYERLLAHWLADHAGAEGATVLAPPYRTSSLCFYGGLRGLGTQNWENGDGLSADLRIVTAMAESEARAVITQRGVTHLVLPSWDSDFDDFSRLRLKNPDDSFVSALRKTDGGIFGWMRPLPFELPPVAGFEDPSVLVLAVTDDTDPATMRSRLVEYLVEMHHVDEAAYASQTLLKYPADLGSQVALAQVSIARGDKEGFTKVFGSIVSNLSKGSDRSLAWDRRVSLAVVLALGGRVELSREQVQRCLGEVDESRLRSLTTESLYHLLLLGRRYHVPIADPRLYLLSVKLLPEKLRGAF